MRIIGTNEANLYEKKGYNMNIVSLGASVNMNEIYDYLKRSRKKPADLSRQEYMMFRK